MALNISYNQEEAIFLGLFFGLLIFSFVFIFVYPNKSTVDYHTQNIMKLLESKTDKELKPLTKSFQKKKTPNVIETPL